MKKFFKITMFLFMLCFISGFSSCVGINKNEKNESQIDFYANYGEWFTLPNAEKITVTDEDGIEVEICDGKIFTDKEGLYKIVLKNGSKKDELVLKVYNNSYPEIFVDKEMVYGVVGEKIELVKATANNKIQDINVDYKMYFNDKEIDISGGFIPKEIGTYNLKLTAEDDNGKKSEKIIDYYIEKDMDEYSNKISSFDKPYGCSQVGYDHGIYTYSDQVAFENESGSLKVDINTLYHPIEYDFMFYNLNQQDISNYDSIYFYVFNSTHANLKMYWSWQLSVTLPMNNWTRVSLNKEDYNTLVMTKLPQQEELTPENINGINLELLYKPTDYIMRGDAVYFSSIRGLNKKGAEIVQSEVDRLNADDNTSILDFDNTEFYYSKLTDTEKNNISGYLEFKQKQTDLVVKNNNIKIEKDKLLYFDEDCGLNQIELSWGVEQAYITKENVFNGKPALSIITDSWDLGIKIIQPYLYSIKDRDILEFSIYNPCDEEYILRNNDQKQQGLGNEKKNYILPPKQWTNIVIPVGNAKTVDDSMIWISPKDWEDEGIKKHSNFLISPLYVRNYDEIVHEYVSKGDYSNKDYLKSLIDAYKYISDESKANATDYEILYDVYLKDIGVNKDQALCFDSEIGLSQLKVEWGAEKLSIVDSITYENKSVLEITLDKVGDVAIQIKKIFLDNIENRDIIEFAVYNPTDKEYLFRNNDKNYKGLGNAKGEFVLKPKSWNKICIPVGDAIENQSLEGRYIWIGDKDWKPIQKGTKFYISSAYICDYDKIINEIIEKDDYTDLNYIKNVLDIYDYMSEETKLKAVNYIVLKNKYDELIK